jgi:hypothetical protein
MNKKGTLRKTLSLRTKLLIYEYKEKFPQMSPDEVCMAFCIEDKAVKRLFEQEFLIIPSKMNKR